MGPGPHVVVATTHEYFEGPRQSQIVPLKICFLVDGLDEFDGDHEQIGKLFKGITSSSRVKVGLSS
jgi:hypothetical protein